MRSHSRALLALLPAALLACASGGGTTGGTGTPDPGTQPIRVNTTWPIVTRYHVDLWLHGFAMVQDDTARIPYFRRGYRSQMVTIKQRANTASALEANREQLRPRLALNRDLINAQFLALQFPSWDQLQQAIDVFLRAEGQPGRASDPTTQQVIAIFAQIFTTAADRDWLRLFTLSLQDEDGRFYRAWWAQRQRDLAPVLARVDTLWEGTYRRRLQAYLDRTQQAGGDFVLSLPLDGEGRAQSGGKRNNIIVTTFPESRDAAIEAIYVFVHESVYPLANSAVGDNTTPSERRAGVVDRYISAAAVRGGVLLLRKLSPDLADGYGQYYLRAANHGGSGDAAVAAAFPLPDAIRVALERQVESVLGGI